MSRAAHWQSTYKLKPLPKCSKCNKEMLLVMVSYSNKNGTFWEWECPKCYRSYPKGKTKEQPHSKEDAFLHVWCKNNRKKKTDIERITCNHKQN